MLWKQLLGTATELIEKHATIIIQINNSNSVRLKLINVANLPQYFILFGEEYHNKIWRDECLLVYAAMATAGVLNIKARWSE